MQKEFKSKNQSFRIPVENDAKAMVEIYTEKMTEFIGDDLKDKQA